MSNHRVHVVTVDDDPGMRRLITAVLDRAGFLVEIAAGADEALTLLRSHPDDVHVLLTDTAMRGLDGLGLAAQVCRAAPGLPTVLLAEWAGPEAVHGLVLRKPFSPSALVAVVEEAVAGCRKPPRREGPARARCSGPVRMILTIAGADQRPGGGAHAEQFVHRRCDLLGRFGRKAAPGCAAHDRRASVSHAGPQRLASRHQPICAQVRHHLHREWRPRPDHRADTYG